MPKTKEDIDSLMKCGLSGILTFIGCIVLCEEFIRRELDMWEFALCFFGASGLNKTLKIIGERVVGKK